MAASRAVDDESAKESHGEASIVFRSVPFACCRKKVTKEFEMGTCVNRNTDLKLPCGTNNFVDPISQILLLALKRLCLF